MKIEDFVFGTWEDDTINSLLENPSIKLEKLL